MCELAFSTACRSASRYAGVSRAEMIAQRVDVVHSEFRRDHCRKFEQIHALNLAISPVVRRTLYISPKRIRCDRQPVASFRRKLEIRLLRRLGRSQAVARSVRVSEGFLGIDGGLESSLMSNPVLLSKYSIGVGDRFAHQAKPQLRACMMAAEAGVDVIPVWNKSNREHIIIGSDPASTRAAADEAVRALGWRKPYYVDADHINLKTVDRFIEPCDFFTIDVADWIGKPAGFDCSRSLRGQASGADRRCSDIWN